MKKFAIVSIFLAAVGLSFSSCERCRTCSYTYKDAATGVVKTVDKGEKCDSKANLDNFENEVKAEAAKVGGEVTCTD